MPEPTQRIILHRLADNIDINALDFADYALQAGGNPWRLFVQVSHTSVPHWKSLVQDYLTVTPQDEIENNSCGFILLVDHGGHHYALTGGYGYLHIAEYANASFGLDVVLRMLDEEQITALHQRNLKGTTRQIFRAVMGYNPLVDGGNFTSILRSLEGKGTFEGRQFRVVGRSSLTLRTARTLADIQAILQDVETLLQQRPKVSFPQGYSIVNDVAVLADLDQRMVDQLASFWAGQAGRDNLYLEFKDPLRQFRSDRFHLTRGGACRFDVADFDLTQIRNEFVQRGVNQLHTSDDVRAIKVTPFANNEPLMKAASIWDMLVCELMVSNVSYIRLDGEWLRIRDELRDNLDARLKQVPVHPGFLPAWSLGQHATELSYNQATAAAKGRGCLDQDFIQFRGYSRLELCDQYDPKNRLFIHVKRTWGSESSYLFTQGVTAAESFKCDKLCRDACVQKWPQLFTGDFGSQKHTVIFGVADMKAADKAFPFNMTYFAKLNLCNAISRLRDLDYGVALAPITLT